jgi:TolB protein
LTINAPSGRGRRRLTFSDLEEVCGASWSPDGSRFVFSRLTPGHLSSEIFVINADGTGEQKLSGEGDGSPAWSPDGRLIVFNSVRSGTSQLWLMGPDGLSPQILTGGVEYSHGAAVWSPNGEEIVFERGDANLPILVRMRTDGGGLVLLTAAGSWDIPSDWLP